MSKYQNINLTASNSSSGLTNTAATPKMDFYSKSKRITEEMRSKVMSMIEERHKEAKTKPKANVLPPKTKQSRNRPKDQRLLLSSVQSQNDMEPRYSYDSISRDILNFLEQRPYSSHSSAKKSNISDEGSV